MLPLGSHFDAFIANATAAVSIRALLQRLLPADRLDQLFLDTAENQYQRQPLFSTTMNLMLHVTQKSAPSRFRHRCV